nr:hypothetical protein [Tanacetum cinerariifolium]
MVYSDQPSYSSLISYTPFPAGRSTGDGRIGHQMADGYAFTKDQQVLKEGRQEDQLQQQGLYNKTEEVEQVYGLMAGFESANVVGVSILLLLIQEHKNTVKTLELQKDWYHKTQLALEEKVRILSANLENTTNTLKYTETLYDQAKIEKKEWEVKLVESLAREVKSLYERFIKAGDMHEVPPTITGTFIPTSSNSVLEETQVTFGSKSPTSITTSEANDFVSYDNSDKSSESKTHDFSSCVSSPLPTNSFSHVDVKILPKSDVQDPSPTNGVSSCSIKENVNPSSDFCNKPRIAASIPAGSRNSSAFTSAGRSIPAASKNRLASIHAASIYAVRSIPAASRNRSSSIHAGSSIPAASRNIPAAIHAGRHIPAGRSNKPAPFHAGRTVPTGWINHTARPFFGPTNLCFDNVHPHVKGGTVTFGGGDGKITGKGTIRTFKLDFENVYYVEELQNFNLFSVVLRIPRKHDLYTFNLSDIQPEQHINCLLAKASFKESTKWHRRMAHVNFKTINRVSITNPYNKTPYELLSGKHDKYFRRNLVPAAGDPAGGIVPTGRALTDGSDPASGVVPTGRALANSIVPASAVPASSFPASSVPADEVLAGSLVSTDSAASNVHAASVFVPVVVPTDYAANSSLPPGHSLGSCAHTTRFPSPFDLGNHHHSAGIFSSSSYDDEFCPDVTNLDSNVDMGPVATRRINSIHLQSQILGDLQSPVQIRSTVQKSKFGESAFISYVQNQNRTNHANRLHCLFACFLSQLEPSSVANALADPDWVAAMQEEMQQFYHQQNKRDARGIVVHNKARLLAQGHRKEEGIDYDEVFTPVARIEAIRLFLAFASYMGFMVYQMDVKSAFLYGEIEEEVYVTQPKGFEDPYNPKHVYMVYVDDIIFGFTNKAWCDEFEVLMKGEFKMSAMGELTFFLGLQVKQLPDGIFISQDKYVKDMLKKFDMDSVRTATTPYEVLKHKSKDEPDDAVNVHLFRSMIGSLMYLIASRSDIMFAESACSRHQCKKQTVVATSSTEAKYVAAASCCGQVLLLVVQVRADDLVFAGGCTLPADVLFLLLLVHVGRCNITTGSSSFPLSDSFLLDDHNKVAYLEKGKGWEAYAQVLDFLNWSHIRSPHLVLIDQLRLEFEYIQKNLERSNLLNFRRSTFHPKPTFDAPPAKRASQGAPQVPAVSTYDPAGVPAAPLIPTDTSLPTASLSDPVVIPIPAVFIAHATVSVPAEPMVDPAESPMDPPLTAPAHGSFEPTVDVPSPSSSRHRRKHLAKKWVTPIVDVADAAMIKFDSDSDDEPLPYAPYASWEMVPSPLGSVHAYHNMAGHTKHFTTLREILHMVEQTDLQRLLSAVDALYQSDDPDTFALLLWGIYIWHLYPRAQVHVLEMVDGRVIHMFVDVSYPLSIGFSCWFLTTLQMVFSSPWLTAKKELTHHEGTALSWLVQEQTLLKTTWSSIHHLLIDDVLTSPEQMATGKDVSNPLMAVMVCQKPLGYFSSPMIHVPKAELVFNPPG